MRPYDWLRSRMAIGCDASTSSWRRSKDHRYLERSQAPRSRDHGQAQEILLYRPSDRLETRDDHVQGDKSYLQGCVRKESVAFSEPNSEVGGSLRDV